MKRVLVLIVLLSAGCSGSPTPSPSPSPSAEIRYANCAEARAASKAPLVKGSPGYRSELDRDGDGVACD